MFRSIFLAALALLLAWSPAGATRPQQDAQAAASRDTAELDAGIVRHMDEGGIVGIGAAILVDRKVVWMKGYGLADRASAAPFTPDTVLNIGSISKTVTGVAMMRAVEQGRLSLDTDINTWLPFKLVNPHHPEAVITLRHLATHTSGISDRWSVYKNTYFYDGATPEPLGQFLRGYLEEGGANYALENFLDAAPGEQQAYSNIGAALAGFVVEQAVGQPLEAYARAQVFGPLGMEATGWSLATIESSRHSKLYIGQNGLSVPIPLYEGSTYPDGGVRTSVADLSKFFAALLKGGAYEGARILRPESAAEMQRFQFSPELKPRNIELDKENAGLFWSTKFSVTRVGHGGSDPGIKTEMLASLDGSVGVIVFSNTSLAGPEMGHYLRILLAVWAQAEAWKAVAADDAAVPR